MVKRHDNVLILDIRVPNQYDDAHIPGAINKPYYNIQQMKNLYQPDKPIVIYSQGSENHQRALCRYAMMRSCAAIARSRRSLMD